MTIRFPSFHPIVRKQWYYGLVRQLICAFILSVFGLVFSTKALAIKMTAVVHFNEINHSLSYVIGYPNGKATVLFYVDNFEYAHDKWFYPKIYMNDNLNSPITLTKNDFWDLRPNNLSEADLIKALGEEAVARQYRTLLTIKKIIWFNGCFYAVGQTGAKSFSADAKQFDTNKTVILSSTDGKIWTADNSANKLIDTQSLIDIVGSGGEHPSLVAIGKNGFIYYKHLIPGEEWRVGDTQLAEMQHTPSANSDVFLTAYKNKFLLIQGSIRGTDKRHVDITYLMSDDGEKWRQLTGPRDLFLSQLLYFPDKDQLIATTAENVAVDENGDFNLNPEEAEKLRESVLAELSLDETTGAITVVNKVNMRGECSLCQYSGYTYLADSITSMTYVNNTDKQNTGNYYLLLANHAFPIERDLSWVKADSLQSLTQAPLLPMTSEAQYVHEAAWRSSFFTFNNQPYFLGYTYTKPSEIINPTIIIKSTLSNDVFDDISFNKYTFLFGRGVGGNFELYEMMKNSAGNSKRLIDIHSVTGLPEILRDLSISTDGSLDMLPSSETAKIREIILAYALTQGLHHSTTTAEPDDFAVYRIDE